MAKILIVDDDSHIRELIKLLLSNEGFHVYEASDGIEALIKLESIKVDMVILDIMMPNMNGWKLCRELRAFYDFPLLMLTAKRETSQKLKGFDMGIDDYLVKPFEPLELVARIKALLKRYQISISQTVLIGGLLLNRKTYEVIYHGQQSTLPLKEFELLFKLASYPGKTFTREQLIEQIWGYDYEGDERTVDVHIKRLRGRFPNYQYEFKIIETESQRVSKINDNLLKLTYLESAEHPLTLQNFRLDAQLRNSVLSCEPQWVAKNIQMDLAFGKINIVADQDLLDQVWTNLLNNAIKFTPNNGMISFAIIEKTDELTITISDTGIGISAEKQLHLFERFYKADKARIRNASGSGLGLSIAKKIIHIHHGTVYVKSKINEGTTFTISLPRDRSQTE